MNSIIEIYILDIGFGVELLIFEYIYQLDTYMAYLCDKSVIYCSFNRVR